MARLARLCTRVASTALLGLALSSSLAAQNPKRFFIGPSYLGGMADYQKLFDPNSHWTFVKRQADVFEFHVNSWQTPVNNPAFLDDDMLKTAIATFADAELDIGVEAGGLRFFPGGTDPINWFKAGEVLAKLEGAGYERWTRLGGSIDVLMLDAPFSYALQDMGMPWTVAARELADYLDIVVAKMPGVEIGLIEPVSHYTLGSFPTWGSAKNFGDLGNLLATVVPLLEARGHHLSFFLADAPYTYTNQTLGGWKKLVEVQKIVRQQHGMRFGWFVNDSTGGSVSEELFFANSLEALKKMRAAGGNPDDFNLRSWYAHPKKTVPESSPYTFTGIARRLMQYVYGHYEAPNDLSQTVSFDDGSVKPFVVNKQGNFSLSKGSLALSSEAEFGLPRRVYEEPTIIAMGDMQGMLPGSKANVVLRVPFDPNSHTISLVSRADGLSHVELWFSNDTFGTHQLVATGATVPVDPLHGPFHLLVRKSEGVLQVEVNRYVSLSVPSPLPEAVAISFAADSDAPFTGHVLFDLIDVREKDSFTNVSVDKDRRVVFSLVQKDLIPAFDETYWLNAFDGEIVSFEDFSSSVLPAMEIVAIRNDHVVLRTIHPVPAGSLISLVYDGDFESVLVK